MITISRVALVLTAVCSLASIASAEPVTVQLVNGQELTADVDPRADTDRLWMRFGGGSTIVLRSIAWERIETASRSGVRISVDDLRRMVADAQPSVPKRVAPTQMNNMSQADLALELVRFVSAETLARN